MSSYDSYVKRIEKIAKAKNFVIKHKIAFMVGAGIAVALSTTFVSTKGIIVKDVSLPDKIVYGSDFEFDQEAVGLFGSKVLYEYRLDDGEWTLSKPTRPGNYEVRAVSKNSFGGKIYGKPISFEIGRKDITIVVNDSSIKYGSYDDISYSIYDGTPEDKDVHSKGLVGSDTIANISFEFEDTSKAKTKVRANQEDVIIKNSDGNDVSELYRVHTELKDITFEKRDLVIEPELVNKTYDGTAIEYNNDYSSLTKNSIASGDELTIFTNIKDGNDNIIEGKPTDVGTYINSIDSFKLINSNGDDVSINYNITYKPNFLVIAPRDITIQTESASKVYDGKPLTCFEYKEIVSGELVNNQIIKYDEAKVDSFSSLKDVHFEDSIVSSIENNIQYSIFEGDVDKTRNYNIKVLPGTLTVSPYEIDISPLEQESYVYNKKNLIYANEEGNFIEVNNKTLPENVTLKLGTKYYKYDDLDNKTLVDSVINVGKYNISIDSIEIVNDIESNYVITKHSCDFEILKRSIKIGTFDVDDHMYDGKETTYDNNKYEILSENDFVEGDSVSVTVSYFLNDELIENAPKNVNDYEVIIKDFTFDNDTMNGNYDISISNIKKGFSITKRTVSIYAESLSSVIYNKNIQDNYDKTVALYEENSNKIVETDSFTLDIDYKYLDGDNEVKVDPINANDYRIYISKVNFSDKNNDLNYDLHLNNGKYGEFSILKKEVVIKAQNLSDIIYDGKIHNDYDENNYSLLNQTSFIEGDNVSVAVDFYKENKVDEELIVDEPRNAGKYYIYINSFNYLDDSMDGNYDIKISVSSEDAATLNILKRDVTLKAIDLESKVYNGKIQDLYDKTKYTYEENSLDIVDEATVSYKYFDEKGEEIDPKNAYEYRILLNDISFKDEVNNDNYNIKYSTIAGIFEITKKDLTISAISKDLVYGNEFIDRDVSYDGFVENEDKNVLDGELLIESTYKKYDDVNEYEINASGLSSINYEITYVKGTLNVTKATLTNETEDIEIIYDGQEHFLNFVYSGLVSSNSDYPYEKEELNEKLEVSLDGDNYSSEYAKYKNACETTEVFYQISFKNYMDIKSSNTITINKRDLLIKANDLEITYGDEVTGFSYTSTGWAPGEDITVLNGELNYLCTYVRYSDIDPNKEYLILISGCSSDNYNITYEAGQLTVKKAKLIDDSKNYEGIYDGKEHGIIVSATGFLNNEVFSDVASITYSLSENGEFIENEILRKDYTANPIIVFYRISFTNYEDIVGSKTITINKAKVTIFANDHEITYGDEPSNNGYGIDGLMDGDDESLFDFSNLIYSYDYEKFNNIGNYTITISNVPDTLNYTVEFAPGVLTVVRKQLDIIWSEEELIYNGVAQAPSATVNVLEGSNDVCKVVYTVGNNIDANDNLGDEKYVATVTSLSNDNYSIGENKTIEYVIKKKGLIISPSEKHIIFGEAFDLKDVVLNYDGFVNNENENVLTFDEIDEKFYTSYSRYDAVEDKFGQEIRYFIEISQDWIHAKNYNIELQNARLYISKAKLVDNSYGYEGTYDGNSHSITLSFSGFISNDIINDTYEEQKTIELYRLENNEYDIDFIKIRNYTGIEPLKVYYKISFINYETIESYQIIIIKQKEITVTANSNSIVYGDKPCGNGVSIDEDALITNKDGIKETIEEHLNNLEGLDYSFDYAQFDNCGSNYLITPNGLTSKNDNYKFVYVPGNLSVTPKEVTIEWNENTELVYTGKEQNISASVVGLVNNDICDVLLSGNGIAVGNYEATIIGLSNTNYVLSESQELTHEYSIIKAQITITTLDKEITYGDDPIVKLSSFGNNDVNFEGFVVGEDVSVLGGKLIFTTNYNQFDNVGTYEIIASGLTSDNYNISYVKGNLVVKELEAIIEWDEENSFIYDGKYHNRVASISNLVNGDSCDLVYEGEAKKAGSYIVTIISLSNRNYKLPLNAIANFIINKKILTDITENVVVDYDASNHYIDVKLEGFVEGEENLFNKAENKLPVKYGKSTLSFTPTNIPIIHVSSSQNGSQSGDYNEEKGYPIYYKFDFENYDVEYDNKTYACNVRYIKINPIDLNDETENVLTSYDTLNHGLNLKVTGFVDGQGENFKDKTFSISYNYNELVRNNPYTFKDVGVYVVSYAITFKYDDYNPIEGAKTITINKAIAIDESTSFEGYYNGYEHGIKVLATLQENEDFNRLARITYSLDDENYSENNISLKNHTPIPVEVFYIIRFDNYEDIIGSRTINIKQRDLLVSCNPVEIIYGEIPSGNGIYYSASENLANSGFINGENSLNTINEKELTYDFSSYNQYDDVGKYGFYARGLNALDPEKDNYHFIYVESILTVNQKEISISWENFEFIYDGFEHYPTPTPSGFVNGDSFELVPYVTEGTSLPIRAREEAYVALAKFKGEVKNYCLPIDNSHEFIIKKLKISLTPNEVFDVSINASKIYDGLEYLYDIDYNNYSISEAEKAKIGHNGLDKILINVSYTKDGIISKPKDVGNYKVIISSFKVVHIEEEVEVDYSECYEIVQESDVSYIIKVLEIMVEANSMDDIEFDGTEHNYPVNNKNYNLVTELDEKVKANILEELEFAISVKFINAKSIESTSIRNAGTYKIITVSDNHISNNIKISYKKDSEAKVTITPKEITINLEDKEITYNGKEFVYDKISLIDGDLLKLNVIYNKVEKSDGTIVNEKNVKPINAGTYEMIINSQSAWYSFELNAKSIEDNYRIVLGEVSEADLVILRRDVYITTEDEDAGEYDGKEHSYSKGYVYYGDSLGNKDSQFIEGQIVNLVVAYNGSVIKPKNAGTYKVSIDTSKTKIKINNLEEELFILENYNVRNEEDHYSSFVIYKRLVGILAKPYENKTYDNVSLDSYPTGWDNFNYDTTVSKNQLVEGEKISVSVVFYKKDVSVELSNVLDAGEYIYKVDSIIDTSNYNEDNYELVFNNSNFVILRRKVYIAPSKMTSIEYDNKDHSYLDQFKESDYTYYGLSVNDPKYQLVSGHILSITVLFNGKEFAHDAGKYIMTINDYSTITTPNEEPYEAGRNYEIITDCKPDIVFEITRKYMKIGSLDQEYIYDDKVYEYPQYSYDTKDSLYAIEGLCDGDRAAISKIVFNYKHSGIFVDPVDAGEYIISLDLENTIISDNYILTAGESSTLTINKRNITLSIEGLTITYSNTIFDSKGLEVVDSFPIDLSQTGFVGNDRDYFKVTKFIYKIDDTIVDPINAGEYSISLEYEFTNEIVKNNYSIEEIIEGQLVINKREVTVLPKISEDEYKEYDGLYYVYPVQDNNYEYFGETLNVCSGHTLTIKVLFSNGITIDPLTLNDINVNELLGVDYFYDKVKESATYKVAAYDYLINGENNDNYDFHSEIAQYTIIPKEITLYNGDYSFTYNGREQSLLDIEDKEIKYLENKIADQVSVDFISNLSYKAFIATDTEYIVNYIDVLYNEEEECISSYENKARIRLYQDDVDKTFNFIITIAPGTIVMNPCNVDFVIDVPEDEANVDFTGEPFIFDDKHFYIETLCNEQTLKIVSFEDMASKIIRTGTYTLDDIDYNSLVFEIYKDDIKISKYNYIFSYRLERELVINQVKLDFGFNDQTIEFNGEVIDVNEFLNPINKEGAFNLSINHISVEPSKLIIYYAITEDESLERVFEIKDAGIYKISINNSDFAIYEEYRNPDFIYDYDGKTEFTITVLKYRFNKTFTVSTGSDIKPFVYDINAPQTASNFEFTYTITSEQFANKINVVLLDEFVKEDYIVRYPQEKNLLNTLPLRIIDIDGNDITKNFMCSKQNDLGQWVIDYESEDIKAEVGEINLDGNMTLRYDIDKKYDGKGISMIEGDYIKGQLYNYNDEFSNLYFKAQIIKIYYRGSFGEYEITNNEQTSNVGTYNFVVTNIGTYLNESCTIPIDSRYYIGYKNIIDEDNSYTDEFESAVVCKMTVLPREVHIKPADVIKADFLGEDIVATEFVYVDNKESNDNFHFIDGHIVKIATTLKIGLEEIHKYQISTTKNTIDANMTKVFDSNGKNVTANYQIISMSEKTNEMRLYYGKISIAQRYVVVVTGGNVNKPHIYNGEYIYNSEFRIIENYRNATEVSSKCTEQNYGLLEGERLIPYDKSTVIKDVGRKFNSLTFNVVDKSGGSLMSLYKIVCRKDDSSYLVVEQRTITITSKSGSKSYDGDTMFTLHEIESVENLAPGDVIDLEKIEWKGYVLGSGAAKNEFIINLDKRNKAILDKHKSVVSQNYKINYVYGNLIVS